MMNIKNSNRAKINITNHAKQRLGERVPEISSVSYNQFVSAARYNGNTLENIYRENIELYKYINQRYKKNNSTQIRIYKDYVFIFSGGNHHYRNLITVNTLPKEILSFA